jgi:hypothetical protein
MFGGICNALTLAIICSLNKFIAGLCSVAPDGVNITPGSGTTGAGGIKNPCSAGNSIVHLAIDEFIAVLNILNASTAVCACDIDGGNVKVIPAAVLILAVNATVGSGVGGVVVDIPAQENGTSALAII